MEDRMIRTHLTFLVCAGVALTAPALPAQPRPTGQPNPRPSAFQLVPGGARLERPAPPRPTPDLQAAARNYARSQQYLPNPPHRPELVRPPVIPPGRPSATGALLNSVQERFDLGSGRL